MSTNKEILADVLTNVQRNAVQIIQQLDVSEKAIVAVGDDEQAAIDLLVTKYGDTEAIGEIIHAQMRIKQLKKTQAEVGVLIAALQVVVSSDNLMGRVDTRLTDVEVPA
jgi:hypothetical protein